MGRVVIVPGHGRMLFCKSGGIKVINIWYMPGQSGAVENLHAGCGGPVWAKMSGMNLCSLSLGEEGWGLGYGVTVLSQE